jgi:preprotein translocase subunit YajC
LKQKELEKTVSELQKGDKIVTSGGLLGIVAGLKEKTVVVKVADNVRVEILRSSVTHVEKTKADS